MRFTVDVPRGWATDIRTVQLSAAEVSQYVRVIPAPDNAIVLLVGDPVPRAYVEMPGIPAGQTVNGMSVLPYMTGGQYAVRAVGQEIATLCKNPQIKEARNLPAAGQTLDFGYNQLGVSYSTDAGEASFACTMNGQPGAAYAFAATQKVAGPGGVSLWASKVYVGFMAPQARAGEAAELLTRVALSIKLDPAWVARTQGTNLDIARIQTETHNAVASTISDTYWYRQAMMDRTFAEGSLARRGVTIYRDPVLGQNHELPSGGYKWIDPSGAIVTTATEDAPGPGFRELQAQRP